MCREETGDPGVCGIRGNPASQEQAEEEEGEEGEEEAEERRRKRRVPPSMILPLQTTLEAFPLHCFLLCRVKEH